MRYIAMENNVKYFDYIAENTSEIIEPRVKLKYVISCYERSDGKQYYELAENYGGILGSFIPVTIDFMVKFAKHILFTVKHKAEKNFLPEKMEIFRFPVIFISRSHNAIMFVDEPKKNQVVFYKGSEKIITGIPKLYYLIIGSSLSVYERKDDGFIGCNLPNIGMNGGVCLGGSVKRTNGMSISELIDLFYDEFWNSSFNSHSDSTGYKWTKSNTFKYIQRKEPAFKLKLAV